MIYAARLQLLYLRYKKQPVLGKFDGIMLNEQQLQHLIKENEALQGQVKELEEILALREEELQLLRQQAAEAGALRSQLDLRLDELASMQNLIGQQQRKTAGAQIREIELQDELADSIQMLHQQKDLQQQYIYANTQLEDLQAALATLKKKNSTLQTIATHAAELESMVENLVFERDILLEKLAELEKIQE
jgi:phage gp16-like protein